MVIDPPTARRFIQVYSAFLLSLVEEKPKSRQSNVQRLVAGRSRHAADPKLLEAYRAAHPVVDAADADLLDAIARSQLRRWVYLRDTRTYSIVLNEDCTQAYAAVGLTQRMRDIGDFGSGVMLETALLPLNGRWVCDGLIADPVVLGPGYRRSFTAQVQALRERGRFSLSPEGG